MAKRKFRNLSEATKRHMIGGDIMPQHLKVTNHVLGKEKGRGHRPATVVVHAHTGFYSDQEAAALVLEQLIERGQALPVRELDPKSIKAPPAKPMEPHEKAYMLARKYKELDPTHELKSIYERHRTKEMEKKDIKRVMAIVETIKLQKVG